MEKNDTNQEKYSQRKKKYDEKRAGQRTRNWTVVFYLDDLPKNWRSLVDDLHFRWLESPLHDQDLNADGQLKKRHYHAVFMFDVVKTLEQVERMLKELFGESETGSIVGVASPQQVIDRTAMVRYMAHLDSPDKAQYDAAGIIGHNGVDPAEILRYSAIETREMIIAMEEHIEQNKVTELVDFSAQIRYDHPEWHMLLTTKMTMYFNAFIRSHRHKLEKNNGSVSVKIVKIDKDTGEIVE